MVFTIANFRWSLALIVLAITGFFLLNLPVTFVDRVQEHWYLGVPYELLKSGRMWINHDDPFPENGPHLMYLIAKAAQLTGSMWSVRLVQWPWSLLAAGFLWLLLDRLTSFSRNGRLEVLALAFAGIFFWVTLPLGFVYPVQTNGMMAGFASVVLGLLLLRTRPRLAMLAFGFGFSCKAQFIMFFPCVICYRLIFDFDGINVGRHLLRVLRDLVLLFVPSVILLPVLFLCLGLFRNSHDFLSHALEGPDLLFAQVSGVVKKIAGSAASDPMVNVRRLEALHAELASYSKLVYMHIFLNATLGLGGLAWASWKLLPVWWKRAAGENAPPKELALLSVMCCVAWLTYFKFNNYPYCYNMLPILPFNFLLGPLVLWWLGSLKILPHFWKGTAALFAALLLFLSLRYTRHFLQDPPGDALKPYYWMEGRAWTTDWKDPK